ncbi:MAG: transglutaminase family protein [Pirellula sp.]|nr:transglutaminase family protein [Pirellula sp.]
MSLRFNVSCQIDYNVECPSTLILNINPQRNSVQTVVEERLTIEPYIQVEEFSDVGGDNRYLRLETGTATQLSIRYEGTVDCAYQFHQPEHMDAESVAKMNQAALPFLFPSRYCQSDRLARLAWDLFGKIQGTYEKVVAISDWIYGNVKYVPGSTDAQTSAFDTVTQREGVCRDFAHLGIALCRALTIPARYFSGYAYQLQPPDFHACFEAYIDGRWLIFDATRLAHLNGLVRIGNTRDAAEAAVASDFGSVSLRQMVVDCQLAPGQHFEPMLKSQLQHQGVSLA